MALENLEQFPQKFPEQNATHLGRTAEVIIIKRLRNFLVPGANEKETEHQTFLREYVEFLAGFGGSGLLKRAKNLDLKWQDPDAPGPSNINYRHYYVSATSDAILGGALIVQSNKTESQPKGNTDVVSVTAKVDTEGRGNCTIVLNGRGQKYQFVKNPFRTGQCVFQSNDIIMVNLPGLDNRLYRVFTGLVTTVRDEVILGDTVQTSITLECEDMLKLLAQSRTAYRPSLSAQLSAGRNFQGMCPDFSGLPPHEIMAKILARAYCDPFTVPGFYDQLTEVRSLKNLDQAAQQEDQLIESMFPIPQPAVGNLAYDSDKPFLVVSSDGKQAVSALDVIAPLRLSSGSKKGTSVPAKIYGYRRKKTNQFQGSTAVDTAAALNAPIQVGEFDDVAFVIEGTVQSAYKLAVQNATSLYFADWRSGLAVCKEIAESLNFEFFADQNGVVRFRPLNITLPKDFALKDKLLPTSKIKNTGQVGVEYWLDVKFIQGNPQFVDTDDGVFTVAYVSSDWQVGDANGAAFKGAAVDLPKFLRLGPRTAPLIQKLLLASDAACEAYAIAYLNRLNANASSATVSYTGDARLRAGNPCYVKHRNTIYYISAITHSFVAGQSYTVNLDLKYGRRPIATAPGGSLLKGVTDGGLFNILNAHTLGDVVNGLLKQGNASPALGAVTKGGSTAFLADYILKNRKNLTFREYIWEPLLPLDYESLLSGLREQTQVNARKEIVENYVMASPAFTAEQQKVFQAFTSSSPAGSLIKLDEQQAVNKTTSNILNYQGAQ